MSYPKLLLWLRLTRPFFLLGGFLLFALGAFVAHYEHYEWRWEVLGTGLLFVLSIQAFGHFLSAYWETTRPNGAEAEPKPQLSRETIFASAAGMLALGSTAAIWLIVQNQVGPGALILIGLIGLCSYFYSSPPLTLVSSGYGELIAAVQMAGLVPALGHYLLAGEASSLVVLSTAPLVFLYWAMLLALEFPDFLQDEAQGRKNLLVRLGRKRGITVHNSLVVLALLFAAGATFTGLPVRVALSAIIVAPLIALQVFNFRRLQRGEPVPLDRLTLLASIIVSLTAYLIAFSFWVISI